MLVTDNQQQPQQQQQPPQPTLTSTTHPPHPHSNPRNSNNSAITASISKPATPPSPSSVLNRRGILRESTNTYQPQRPLTPTNTAPQQQQTTFTKPPRYYAYAYRSNRSLAPPAVVAVQQQPQQTGHHQQQQHHSHPRPASAGAHPLYRNTPPRGTVLVRTSSSGAGAFRRDQLRRRSHPLRQQQQQQQQQHLVPPPDTASQQPLTATDQPVYYYYYYDDPSGHSTSSHPPHHYLPHPPKHHYHIPFTQQQQYSVTDSQSAFSVPAHVGATSQQQLEPPHRHHHHQVRKSPPANEKMTVHTTEQFDNNSKGGGVTTVVRTHEVRERIVTGPASVGTPTAASGNLYRSQQQSPSAQQLQKTTTTITTTTMGGGTGDDATTGTTTTTRTTSSAHVPALVSAVQNQHKGSTVSGYASSVGATPSRHHQHHLQQLQQEQQQQQHLQPSRGSTLPSTMTTLMSKQGTPVRVVHVYKPVTEYKQDFDNPFRPDGRLYHEVEPIVDAWKGARPITPTELREILTHNGHAAPHQVHAPPPLPPTVLSPVRQSPADNNGAVLNSYSTTNANSGTNRTATTNAAGVEDSRIEISETRQRIDSVSSAEEATLVKGKKDKKKKKKDKKDKERSTSKHHHRHYEEHEVQTSPGIAVQTAEINNKKPTSIQSTPVKIVGVQHQLNNGGRVVESYEHEEMVETKVETPDLQQQQQHHVTSPTKSVGSKVQTPLTSPTKEAALLTTTKTTTTTTTSTVNTADNLTSVGLAKGRLPPASERAASGAGRLLAAEPDDGQLIGGSLDGTATEGATLTLDNKKGKRRKNGKSTGCGECSVM